MTPTPYQHEIYIRLINADFRIIHKMFALTDKPGQAELRAFVEALRR